MRKQQGFFSLVAILLILLVGFLATSAVSSYNTEVIATTTDIAAQQALLAAHAGMERAGNRLLTSNASLRLSCLNSDSNAITGAAVMTNATLGSSIAQFTVVNRHPSGGMYASSAATLTAAATAAATTFTVNSTTNYANSGWLVVGSEIVGYTAKTATSFTGLSRGLRGTQAAAYTIGKALQQNQCDLSSTGAVKNFTTPFAKRQINFSVAYSVPIQDGWVVGHKVSSTNRVVRWNSPTTNVWNYQTAAATNDNLHDVDVLDANNAWAVGKSLSGPTRFNIIRWNGSSWAASSGLPTVVNSNYVRDLQNVSAVSINEAWAVGNRYNTGANNYTILRWNGSQWCLLGPGGNSCSSISIPTGAAGRDLRGVQVLDSNGDGVGDFGFAVGQNAYILRFNGSSWTEVHVGGNDLQNLVMVSTQDGWAVGNAGDIYRWNGSSWSQLSPQPGIAGGAQWRGVAMLDTTGDGIADEGWIVGQSDRAARYQNGVWTDKNTSGMGHLNEVAMFATNNVWAVADGGDMAHWNGTAWTRVAPPSGATEHLKAIAVTFSSYTILGNWQEIFGA